MADTDETHTNVSELKISNEIYNLIDLEARKTFMQYYDKLHGPQGSITGVLDKKDLSLDKDAFNVNDVYLSYIFNVDISHYEIALVCKTGISTEWHWRKIVIAQKDSAPDYGQLVLELDEHNNPKTNGGIGFYSKKASCVFGFIRLNTFNGNSGNNIASNRHNNWIDLANRINNRSELEKDALE